MSQKVRIVEVGPRDGLQNEKITLSPEIRVEMAQRLARAGLNDIEIGSFVSEKWVPQMAHSSDVLKHCLELQAHGHIEKHINLPVLVPNLRGLHDAVSAGAREVAIFGAASESFSQANINCSINESLERFAEVVKDAAAHNVRVRGYLSTAFSCPFEGDIDPMKVARLAERYLELGVYEVSFGDTVGGATPRSVRKLLEHLKSAVSHHKVAMHFHDTRGMALANILASLDYGVSVFDASIGGLGGCPYAPAATGNVATEDVTYMLNDMGFETGVDLDQLLEINHWLSGIMQRKLPSRVGAAGRLNPKPFKKRR